MEAALALSRMIDKATWLIGRSVSWLILAAILVSAANATSRKLFSISSNAYLELQWFLFGAAYLLAAAYTLQRNEHIRIDIISNMLSKTLRNWIDIIGHVVMLLPLTTLMIWEATPWFLRSYRIGEKSSNFGGLIQWPAKGLIIVGFSLLALQAISEIIKRIAVIRGDIPDPYDTASAAPIE